MSSIRFWRNFNNICIGWSASLYKRLKNKLDSILWSVYWVSKSHSHLWYCFVLGSHGTFITKKRNSLLNYILARVNCIILFYITISIDKGTMIFANFKSSKLDTVLQFDLDFINILLYLISLHNQLFFSYKILATYISHMFIFTEMKSVSYMCDT